MTDINPTEGGTYRRLPDGSLQKIDAQELPSLQVDVPEAPSHIEPEEPAQTHDVGFDAD